MAYIQFYTSASISAEFIKIVNMRRTMHSMIIFPQTRRNLQINFNRNAVILENLQICQDS